MQLTVKRCVVVCALLLVLVLAFAARAQLAEPDKMPRDVAQETRADLLQLEKIERERAPLIKRIEARAKLYRLDLSRPLDQQINFDTGEIIRPAAK